jgi:hypothetical protein
VKIKKNQKEVHVGIMVQCASHRELLKVAQSTGSGRIVLYVGPCEACWQEAKKQAEEKYTNAVRRLAEQL